MSHNSFYFIAAVLLAATEGSQAANLFISPAAQTIHAGSTAQIDVNISDLGRGIAPSIGTFDFDLGFDTTRLSFQSVSFGSGLDILRLGSLQNSVLSGSMVNLFELSLDSASDLNSLQPDNFVLATVVFNTFGAGDAVFTISVNAIGDADGNSIPITMGTSAKVTVLSVPEPATYSFFALGLLGIAIATRRCGVPSNGLQISSSKRP